MAERPPKRRRSAYDSDEGERRRPENERLREKVDEQAKSSISCLARLRRSLDSRLARHADAPHAYIRLNLNDRHDTRDRRQRVRTSKVPGDAGITGVVVCATYRIYRMAERSNPALSANYGPPFSSARARNQRDSNSLCHVLRSAQKY